MRALAAIIITSHLIVVSCNSAAAPVSISNRPATINDVPLKKPLNELGWVDAAGKETNLGDLKGKAVILDFWATYCIPCKDEIPHLNDLQAKYADSGLYVVGLNSGGIEDRPKIEPFIRETPIKYEIAFPDESLIGAIFDGDDRIPQTLVLNRQGQIVRKIVGFNDQLKLQLDEAVQIAVNSQ